MQALRVAYFALAVFLLTSSFLAVIANADDSEFCPSCPKCDHKCQAQEFAKILPITGMKHMTSRLSIRSVANRNARQVFDNEEDTLVIDLDTLGAEPKDWVLGDGMTLRLSRNSEHQLTLSLKMTEAASDDQMDDCEAKELAELPLLPMPAVINDHREEGVALFQIQYARLMAQGMENEARELATQFLADDQPASATSDFPRGCLIPPIRSSSTRSATTEQMN